jgi:hypothetical protein
MPRNLIIVFFILTASCVTPQLRSLRGYENLVASDSLKVVELRVAHFGNIRKCPDCVLVEYLEEDERSAYFVNARADCQLTPEDVSEFEFTDDVNDVLLVLTATARRRLRDCLDSASDPNSSNWVLFTVRGQPVAMDLLSGGERVLFIDAINPPQLIDSLELYRKPKMSET